jgi:hypothetical protein
MRTTNFRALPALALCCFLAGPALAEMTGPEIKEMFSGNTIYLETTGASVTGTPGKGVIYFAPDGSALYKTPKGVMWHGTWGIKGNTNCTDWKEAPNSACNKYDKQGAVTNIINSTTGELRAKIVKTAPGNVENLAP